MSVVVVGGHCGMKGKYKDICMEHGYRAKVFTKMPPKLDKAIGCPKGIVLFTKPVSHMMAHAVIREARRKGIPLVRCHNGSVKALEDCLECLSQEISR